MERLYEKLVRSSFFLQIYHFLGHTMLSSFLTNSLLHSFEVTVQRIGILATKRVSLLCESLLQVKEIRLCI